MNFFNQIHETQITRYVRQPRLVSRRSTPLHRLLFPVDQSRHQAGDATG